MADVFTKEKRSWVMARIRSRGNRDSELALAALLRTHHISGWRRHLPVTGRPDFAFPRERVAVFVDGCFWHSCPKCGTKPASNREFWRAKLAANRRRDRAVNRMLRHEGWTVLRIWEHQLRKPGPALRRLLSELQSQKARAVTRTLKRRFSPWETLRTGSIGSTTTQR